jgi:hypothetical protein
MNDSPEKRPLNRIAIGMARHPTFSASFAPFAVSRFCQWTH